MQIMSGKLQTPAGVQKATRRHSHTVHVRAQFLAQRHILINYISKYSSLYNTAHIALFESTLSCSKHRS